MKVFIFFLFISFNFLSCRPPEVEGLEEGDSHVLALLGKEDQKVYMADFGDTEADVVNMNVWDFSQKIVVFNSDVDNKVRLICRSLNGCLKVCDHLEGQNNCRQRAVNKVRNLWLQNISAYKSYEQALKDLTLIATEPDVASFLKIADKKNKVLARLFHQSAQADCPQAEDPEKELKISASQTSPPAISLFLADLMESSAVEPASPTAEECSLEDSAPSAYSSSLYPLSHVAVQAYLQANLQQAASEAESAEDSSEKVAETQTVCSTDTQAVAQNGDSAPVSAQDGVQESGLKVKKIVDGSRVPFNHLVFHSFIKQCFGHQTKTFSEMSAQIENKLAFELADKLISKTCGDVADCKRLAYCSTGSELVWNYLPEEMKKAGCAYSSFPGMM